MLTALSQAIEARDPYALGHSARVSALAEAFARFLGWEDAQVARLQLGAQLHDIGKLAVEVEVLCKPAALTENEAEQVRTHPAVGARMLQFLAEARPVLPCVLYHHERWDGRGYPTGRSREEIPVEARVLAIADAFDAMTSFRPYRPSLDAERALDELACCAGSQFDPRLAWVFVEGWLAGELAPPLEPATRAAAS